MFVLYVKRLVELKIDGILLGLSEEKSRAQKGTTAARRQVCGDELQHELHERHIIIVEDFLDALSIRFVFVFKLEDFKILNRR